MKRAKRRKNPSIRHKFVAWDGTLHTTPLVAGDPTVSALQKILWDVAKRSPALHRYLTFDVKSLKDFRPVITDGRVIPFNPEWVK